MTSAYLRTDATIAGHDLFEGCKFDRESEVSTVAVTMILFQFGCLSFFRHFGGSARGFL